MVKNIFGSKKCLGQNYILGQKKFLSKKFLDQKIFGSKKIWLKKILGQKFLGLKRFWSKRFGSEFFFWFKRNQVGLTQDGGYMTHDPPPQKIVGLKLCWIVVSLAW